MRRLMVLGLVAGLATVLLVAVAASAKPDKVTVCHLNILGEWQVNLVSANGKALDAHLAHGDGLPGGGDVPGMPGYGFDEGCVPVVDGSIVVKKETTPAGGTGFEFTHDIASPNSFTLDDGAFESFTSVVAGTYSVIEMVPPGWDLTSASCDDGSPVTAINLSAGETVTCTFTNIQRGRILVEKVTDPAGSFDVFTFRANYGDFTVAVTDGVPNDSGLLAPGVYSVSEDALSGWTLTSATCDNGDDPSAITLGPGETVTCTFTNSEWGRILVEKVTDPAGSFDVFTFRANYGDFTVAVTDGVPNDSGLLAPGVYSVSEDALSGWTLTSATCDNGDDPSAITLGLNQTVTCTFTNTAN